MSPALIVLALALRLPPAGEGLQVGFAKRVITPPLSGRPVYLAGFGQNRPATGVHDDLEKTRGLLASRLSRPVYLLVASTHNHQGPDTLGLWGPSPLQSGVDPAYLEVVRERAAEAAAEAVESLQPARLVLARARTPGLIEDGRLPRVIDDELVVAQALGPDGRTLGTIVIWSSHPEALGRRNTLITADYPHFLVSRVESALGGTCVFFAGSIGGLMTR